MRRCRTRCLPTDGGDVKPVELPSNEAGTVFSREAVAFQATEYVTTNSRMKVASRNYVALLSVSNPGASSIASAYRKSKRRRELVMEDYSKWPEALYGPYPLGPRLPKRKEA